MHLKIANIHDETFHMHLSPRLASFKCFNCVLVKIVQNIEQFLQKNMKSHKKKPCAGGNRRERLEIKIPFGDGSRGNVGPN